MSSFENSTANRPYFTFSFGVIVVKKAFLSIGMTIAYTKVETTSSQKQKGDTL